MIIGIVREISPKTRDERYSAARPTDTMTFLLYKEYRAGKKVITNYHTAFSQYMETDCIFKNIGENIGCVFGIGHLDTFLNTVDKKDLQMIINTFRRHFVMTPHNVIYTANRFPSIHKSLRELTCSVYTQMAFHQKKGQGKKEPCAFVICKEKHRILVFQELPEPYTEQRIKPIFAFNQQKIEKLYDPNEIPWHGGLIS